MIAMDSLHTLIEHTLLTPDTDKDAVVRLCREAQENQLSAVCIPPYFVSLAERELRDTPIKVITVVGFPMGYSATPAKVEEIKRAIDDGADEIDVVVNICAVRNGDWSYVRNDIDSMTRAVHLKGKVIKVIVETSLLTRDELDRILDICNELDVDFVKTSTGFHGKAVTRDDVAYLRSRLSPNIKIKASGGIRRADEARQLVDAGAIRLGSSRSLELIES